MRDTKLINVHIEKVVKDKKQMQLFKDLKKEVETGANGTQDYIIKKGINKDKKAEKADKL
mgnify:CR=1 FL=1|jgi:hypothetical protein|tara:strand:- start:151 stop:330 length:180 start_codon:yes stop_codon:yes gene_type:complete